MTLTHLYNSPKEPGEASTDIRYTRIADYRNRERLSNCKEEIETREIFRLKAERTRRLADEVHQQHLADEARRRAAEEAVQRKAMESHAARETPE